MSALNTTTCKYRNYDGLQQIKQEAIRLNIHHPTIIDIGPGGLINFLFHYFPTEKKERTTQEVLYRGLIKLVESALRKTDLFDLESSEPREIAEIFSDLQPEVVYVVDREPKVVEAVKRMVERNGIAVNFDYVLIDIATQQIQHQGDIVVAYNVVLGKRDGDKMLEAVAKSVKTDGLLSIRPDIQIQGFRKVNNGLYQKKNLNKINHYSKLLQKLNQFIRLLELHEFLLCH